MKATPPIPQQAPKADTCPNCHIGLMKPSQRAYLMMFHGQVVSLPNIHGDECDVCGIFSYDEAELTRLYAIVGAEALPRDIERTTARPALRESDGLEIDDKSGETARVKANLGR